MADNFAERAAQWDQNPERLAASRAFLEAMTPLAGQRLGGRVLDFGAGTGLIGLPLAATASHVDLLDSSPGMMEVLRSKIAAEGLSANRAPEPLVHRERAHLAWHRHGQG